MAYILLFFFVGPACSGESKEQKEQTEPQEPGIWKQVSAGGEASCGLTLNGSLACWGNLDSYYNADSGETPNDVPEGEELAQLSVGWLHACAVRASDGSAYCWGEHGDGRTDAPLGAFTSVEAGYFHSCGLTTTGEVMCWGLDNTGDGAITGVPTDVVFQSISVGYDYACGITTMGEIRCWGHDGSGSSAGQASPPSGIFLDVASDYHHTCGIKEDGSIVCWGYDVGEPPSGEFIALSVGGHGDQATNCGLRENGSVSCWMREVRQEYSGPFESVDAGDYHVCGVTLNNDILCWGADYSGQSSPPDAEDVEVGDE